MEFWGMLVVFAAVAIAAISAETATFPEIARERSNTRIVSGWEAEEGQLPFQLSLRMVASNGGVSSCGASIINAQWGLTAAHCTATRISFVLRAGVVNLSLPYNIFETTKYYNYPLYDNSRPGVVQPHDIGLLDFGRKLVFNDLVQPIRLQRDESKNVDYEGVRLVASGWGRTWTNGASPENLNWVYLRGRTNFACWMLYGAIIVDSTICASGYNDTTQSTCQGDSGGPLTVIDDDGEISQVGVTSFVSGSGCHTDFPAGFVRPGHYHDWFYEVTGIKFDWEFTPEPTTPAPTEGPTDSPTDGPTDAPTGGPTDAPTGRPTDGPTDSPTGRPTDGPTDSPTAAPTDAPEEWDPDCKDEEES